MTPPPLERLRRWAGLKPRLAPDEQGDRLVYANAPARNADYCDNLVITSRYTVYNFLPVFLLEQFARFANAYFLFVAVLQTIKEISITNGVPMTFVPLSIVLLFDGLVTGREDYKRHKDDARANESKCLAMRDGAFEAVAWRDIRVGDVLKIARNAAVPADCVFLASHSQDTNQPDTCYVQTAQLDGETNLKLRQALPATVARFRTDADVAAFTGYVRCEAPNAAFDKFVGTITLTDTSGSRRPPTVASATRVETLRSLGSASGGSGSSTGSSSSGSGATIVRSVSNPLQGVVPGPAAGGDDDGGSSGVPGDIEHHGADENHEDEATRPLPLEAEQTLLRGSIIRNVDHVYGLAVYTGRETKVRVRQTTATVKRALVETEINRMIVCLLAVLLAFCLAGAIGFTLWTDASWGTHAYLGFDGRTSPLEGVRSFFTFFLLNASFIPVSLYVTVRLARSFQMWFMEQDGQMFHEEPALVAASGGLEGQYPFKVRSMDLNDTLGQVTHVFSDKTGTLTLNWMEFRKAVIGGVAYGLGTTQIGVDRLRREGKDVAHLEAALEAERARGKPAGALPHVNFEDGSESHPGRTLAGDAANPGDGGQGAAIHDFLLHLALNHTVLPEVVRDAAGEVVGARLSASSPDEEAFLYAAESLGYKFVARAHDVVVLRCRWPAAPTREHPHALPFADAAALPPAPATGRLARHGSHAVPPVNPLFLPPAGSPLAAGCDLPFRVLAILAYTQERKRMSVLVEHPVRVAGAGGSGVSYQLTGQGPVYLYCKGADSVVLPRCRAEGRAESAALRRTRGTLSDWGNDGLRTLVFAQRHVPPGELGPWLERYTAACADIEQIRRRKAKQPNAIDELMNGLEAGLHLQGATANEDKLQPEVPETIALLGQAGIRTWMVTGDKQETAVNIGFATRLLDESMRQIVATQESAGGVQAAVKRIRIAAKRMRRERREDAAAAAAGRSSTEAAVAWVAKRIEALESGLGFASAAGDNSEAALAKASSASGSAPASGAGASDPASASAGLPRLLSMSLFTRSSEGGLASPPPGGARPASAASTASSLRPPALSAASSAARGGADVDVVVATGLPASPTARRRADSFASEADEEDFQGDLAASITHAHATEVGTPSAPGTPLVTNTDGGGGSSGEHHQQHQQLHGPGRPAAAADNPVATKAPAFAAGGGQLSLRAAVPSTTSAGSSPPGGLLHPPRRPFALVIDEHTLDAALEHPKSRAYLLYVAVKCAAVIACRARPDQKARIVRLIRDGVPASRTLAIGDGANDVNMIRCAHVGVGIAGAEGVQAANASDYAIGRFRFLQRLLLVHGRWNYNRMARLVLYSFWKNIVFVSTQFWFSLFTGWSGQKFYVELGTQTFNLVFTSLPILVLGILDRDVDDAYALRFPQLYDDGRLARNLNVRVFWSWAAGALLEAAAIFFVVLACYGYSPDPGGYTPYVFQLGTAAFSCVIASVTARVAAEQHRHFWFFGVVCAGSALLWVPACFVFDAMNADAMQGGMRHVFGSANFWLTLLLVLGISVSRLLAWKSWKRLYHPQLRHIVQEVQAITHDPEPVRRYCEAADLGRRTGRTVAEVFAAAALVDAGRAALQAQRKALRVQKSALQVTSTAESTATGTAASAASAAAS